MITDIVVSGIVIILIIIAVRSYIKQRSKRSCGGGCTGCSMKCGRKK